LESAQSFRPECSDLPATSEQIKINVIENSPADDKRGFIRVKPTGRLTDAILVACDCKLRSLPEFHAGFPTLLDLSATTALEVTSQMVASLGRAAENDKNCMAIIAPSTAGFGMARMFETLGDVTDLRITVVRDEQAAMDWLRSCELEILLRSVPCWRSAV
jgi:hypothetical protein